MSYTGKTYSVPFNTGGLTHNPNVDMINPTDMIPPSRNIDLDENGRRKRGGTARRQDSDYDGAILNTTELMPNQVDRDFSGASAWTNVDINSYDETGDLTITATAVGQYCTLPAASAPMTVGKSYVLEFDVANIVGSWTVKDYSGTQTLGTISANGTDQTISFESDTVGGLRIISAAANSSGDLDNFSLKATTQIMGLYNYRLISGTSYVVVAANNGYLYKDHETEIIDGANTMSTTTFFDFEVFEDELYIVDGKTCPQKWTGGGGDAAKLTDIPADWAGTSYPQWIIKHGSGNSERLWAGGCSGTPYTIYASVNGDGDDFSDANVTTIYIETGDGFGIVGAIKFGDRLICFGKQQAYIIDDLDVDTANWGYNETQWKGGVCNFRCIVRIPNDIICFTEDGEIYSVIAAETYGDYKAASLIRSSFMHRWIREYVDLASFNYFHGIFDPYQRCVRYFVRRNGQSSYNDICLKYYIDRPLNEAWMVDDNPDYVNGFRASASALVRESAGVWKIYTGDYAGDIWRLNEANRNDNGQAYYGGFKLPNLPLDNPRIDKHYKRGWLLTRPEGDWNLNIKWWIDGVQQTTKTVSLAGAGALLDDFLLDTDSLAGEELINTSFALGQYGKRIQFEIYNDTVNQDFYVSRLLIDHKETGASPD